MVSITAPRARVGGDYSAKGVEYESQGQAPNNVRRVAPGMSAKIVKLWKSGIIEFDRTFTALFKMISSYPGSTGSAALHARPWLSYCAPLGAQPFIAKPPDGLKPRNAVLLRIIIFLINRLNR